MNELMRIVIIILETEKESRLITRITLQICYHFISDNYLLLRGQYFINPKKVRDVQNSSYLQ